MYVCLYKYIYIHIGDCLIDHLVCENSQRVMLRGHMTCQNLIFYCTHEKGARYELCLIVNRLSQLNDLNKLATIHACIYVVV